MQQQKKEQVKNIEDVRTQNGFIIGELSQEEDGK